MKFTLFLLGTAGLVAVGCAPQPPQDVSALTAPADPSVNIRRVRPVNVLGGYTHRQPVEPKSWRELNESQTPARSGS